MVLDQRVDEEAPLVGLVREPALERCEDRLERVTTSASRLLGLALQPPRPDLLVALDALKLTVATYWRPSGKNIHRLKSATEADPWGVSPNAGMEVRLTRDEARQIYEYRSQRDVIRSAASPPATDMRVPMEVDPQLRKAVEVLDEALAKPRTKVAAG